MTVIPGTRSKLPENAPLQDLGLGALSSLEVVRTPPTEEERPPQLKAEPCIIDVFLTGSLLANMVTNMHKIKL